MAKLETTEDALWLMGHVRFYTHGSPEFNYNNHPIIHGPIIGIHNGVIRNYNDILKDTGREDKRAQVDSEAIFAAIKHYGIRKGIDKIRGDAAIAFVDDSRPESMYVGRTSGRPLVYARTAAGSFIFASEPEVLDAGGFPLAGKSYTTASPNRIMRITEGRVDKRIRLTPQKSYSYTASGSGSWKPGNTFGNPNAGSYRYHSDGDGFIWQPGGGLGSNQTAITQTGEMLLSKQCNCRHRALMIQAGRLQIPSAHESLCPYRMRLEEDELARSPVKFDHELNPDEVLADLNARPMVRRAIANSPNGTAIQEFFVWDGRLVSEEDYIDLAQKEMDLAAAFAEWNDA